MKKSNYIAPELEKIEFITDVVTASINTNGYNEIDGDVVNPNESFWN